MLGLAGLSGLLGAQMALGREHDPHPGWIVLGIFFMGLWVLGGERSPRSTIQERANAVWSDRPERPAAAPTTPPPNEGLRKAPRKRCGCLYGSYCELCEVDVA